MSSAEKSSHHARRAVTPLVVAPVGNFEAINNHEHIVALVGMLGAADLTAPCDKKYAEPHPVGHSLPAELLLPDDW